MSLLARFTALVLGASAPVRDPRLPRVTNTVIDGRISPEREAKLIEDGRRAVDEFWVRSTHVERDHHFSPPRFGV